VPRATTPPGGDRRNDARTFTLATALHVIAHGLKRGDDFFRHSLHPFEGWGKITDERGKQLGEVSRATANAWVKRGWTVHYCDGYAITPEGWKAAKGAAKATPKLAS